MAPRLAHQGVGAPAINLVARASCLPLFVRVVAPVAPKMKRLVDVRVLLLLMRVVQALVDVRVPLLLMWMLL